MGTRQGAAVGMLVLLLHKAVNMQAEAARWARAASDPAPRDLVVLGDARLAGEPDFHVAPRDRPVFGDLRRAGGTYFLKSLIAPSARPRHHGRSESLRQPVARRSRLRVRLATATLNASYSRWRRSMIRRRTTPWIAGVGPLPIIAARAARHATSSRGDYPGALRSMGPLARAR